MITEHQLQIYNNLLDNTKKSESFYIVDQTFDNIVYRIFSYRIASYSDFLLPDAREARGIVFQMDEDNKPVRLVARTPHKFFNLDENPMTMNLDLSLNNIHMIMDKADGSLISAFLDHYGNLCVKSKTSLFSDQVRMAWTVIDQDHLLKDALHFTCQAGYTVNMEYVGPDNRIVLGYEKPALKILSVRHNDTGEYLQSVYGPDSAFARWMIKVYPKDFDLNSLADAKDFEGVVVVLKSGQWFKHKTPWYLALHKTKDSINSKRRLFECVIMETVDELKTLFATDPVAITLIVEMEAKIAPKFNHVVKQVETFYQDNKQLDRKSYAIKGQAELPREIFSLAMNLYLGKEANFKEWAVKHYEWFGVKDEVIITE